MVGTTIRGNALRVVVVGVLVVGVFLGAYRFASAKSAQATSKAVDVATSLTTDPGSAASRGAVPADGSATASGGSGCACCDGSSTPAKDGVSGDVDEGVAKLMGGVQTISVSVASVYSPNVIKLKAGVPAEITFAQSSGCTALVQSLDLNFAEDLSAGPRTIKLSAPKAGTYAFSCGMNMVFGKIVVE